MRGRSARSLLTTATAGGIGLLLAVTLAGCRPDPDDGYFAAMAEPAKRHPIVVTADKPTLELNVPRLALGLTPEGRFEVVKFMRKFKTAGEGRLLVSLPASRRGAKEVVASLEDIRLMAIRNGLPPHLMLVKYHGDVTPDGSVIRLSYHRIAAIAGDCGEWDRDVGRNRENLPYPNFGCAQQKNLAAMVANPTDLILSAEETPRASELRSFHWKKYIEPKGEEADKQKALPNAKQQ
jgi:pilus assembly protein CpaD